MAGIVVPNGGRHAGFSLGEILDLGMMENTDARARRRVRKQQRLEINLVDPMRRLRRRPPGVRPAGRRESLVARRDGNARELDPGRRRAERDIVRKIRRKPRLAQALGDAEAPEDLHGTRRHVIAADARRLAGAATFADDDVDPAPRQVHGERQADRPGPHDEHLSLDRAFHCPFRPSSTRAGRYARVSGRARTESSAAIVGAFRNLPGAAPKRRRKQRLKWETSPKPQS